MFGLSRILFPTDLSPDGRQAFLQAASLAARCGAEVHVLHVVPEALALPDELATFLPFEETRLREQLDIDLLTWHAHIGAGMASRVRFVRADAPGLPPDVAILSYAARYEIDLIVMATHGRRGLWHLLFGSVAEAVLHETTCPVMTTHQTEMLRSVQYEHVLVPIDFSSRAGQALAYAKRLALLHHAHVSLLFVAEAHTVSIPYDTGIPAVTRLEADPEITARAEEALQQFDATTEAADVPTTYHVRHGDPAREVLTFAQTHGVDLIVMSRHGHTPVTSDKMSPVTEKVIRTATCPVITLPEVLSAAQADDREATEHTGAHFMSRYHHGPL